MSLKPNNGNFKKLLDNINELGYKIQVPTPMFRMKEILIKRGMKPKIIFDKYFQSNIEVWCD